MTLSEEFLASGIVKISVEDMETLDSICGQLAGMISLDSGKSHHQQFMDNIHHFVPPDNLNGFRLGYIKELNNITDIKPLYFSLAKNAIEELVGNELVMQRNINLSIQMPGDTSSLLPRHKDSLQGDSPFEVVLWVPLVDCYETKSMFFQKRNTDIEEFIDCKYGECLIFSQNYWHGNVVNETSETRWSMNCRFKSALSPYGDKKLGEFFEPITIRAATRMGYTYKESLI